MESDLLAPGIVLTVDCGGTDIGYRLVETDTSLTVRTDRVETGGNDILCKLWE